MAGKRFWRVGAPESQRQRTLSGSVPMHPRRSQAAFATSLPGHQHPGSPFVGKWSFAAPHAHEALRAQMRSTRSTLGGSIASSRHWVSSRSTIAAISPPASAAGVISKPFSQGIGVGNGCFSEAVSNANLGAKAFRRSFSEEQSAIGMDSSVAPRRRYPETPDRMARVGTGP
jgi:hypothetical protein